MTDKDFQAISEIGKIFNSFHEKSYLTEYFLDSAMMFIRASKGLLFLASQKGELWLETSSDNNKEASEDFIRQTTDYFKSGKPRIEQRVLYLPLVVRNAAIGIACFFRDPKTEEEFTEREMNLGFDLSSQAAAALKNILLNEDNIRMERLAAIGQTMGMVLHEIKNIVQLANFSQEFLRMGIYEKKEKFLSKGYDGMRKAIRELDGFTYEVLSLTKDYKIQPEILEVERFLNELKEDLQPKAAQCRVTIETRFDPGMPAVEGESRSLYRTLVNLVKNAIEAADLEKEAPFIRVSFLLKDERSYEIVVEDNGLGMNAEAKAKIFQAFFSTKGEKGTGLGLLVIDRTVKAHGGSIQVESEPRKGTRFTLTLPRILPRN